MRNFNRALIATTVAGASALGLTACGASVKRDQWVVGVACPSDTTPSVVHTSDFTSSVNRADIDITCTDKSNNQVSPTDIELLAGRGASISGPQTAHLSRLVINYEWKNDGGFSDVKQSPTLSYDIAGIIDGQAEISALDIEHLDNVGFQAPASPPSQ